MRPEEPDHAHLWDMLEAAREVVSYTAGVTFTVYASDRMRQRAAERAIEIVGEAARRVSETFRAAHPEIPWRSIIAQRNVIAHEYGEIVQARLWRVAVEDVPNLVEQLERLLPPPPQAP